MGRLRTTTADYTKGGYFINPPALTRDIQKYISDVHDYAWDVLEGYGGERVPLGELSNYDKTFPNEDNSDDLIPADAFFAQWILHNVYFAQKYLNKGLVKPRRSLTGHLCFNVGRIVELLNQPIKEKQTNIGKGTGGTKSTALKPVIKFIETILKDKNNSKSTSDEIWSFIAESISSDEDEYSISIDGENLNMFNNDTGILRTIKKPSFPRYVKKAKGNIKKLH